MSYFQETPTYDTYSNSEADFHFIYNANSGGGQAFLGGKYYDVDGHLVSPETLNGKTSVFYVKYTDESGIIQEIALNDPKAKYIIKPRSTGSTSMKLGVEDRETPSRIISSFFMLPPTCGVKKPVNLNHSILSSSNYWLYSMWLDCNVDELNSNEIKLIPKDYVFCGGINNDNNTGNARYFSLNSNKRILDIINLASTAETILPDEIMRNIKLFSDIYLGRCEYNYDECSTAIKDIMVQLALLYPEKYSGISDPLAALVEIVNNQQDNNYNEQQSLIDTDGEDYPTTDILNHNLFGIHIKEQNDALSEERPHICIGWSALGDLSDVASKEELTKLFAETWPDAKPKSQGQNVGQVWRFKNDMQIGDYVVFSDGNLLHIGRVESDYYYDETVYSTQDSDYKNSRKVVWLKKNIQRTELSEALHRALGVGMSIWTMNDYRAAIADLINGTYVKDENEDGEESGDLRYCTHLSSSKPRNRIVFGAPGTGKSFMLNRERKELLGEDNNADYERVTFHPDYSYANFVGTYKPISAFDSEGKEIITYEYVPGPFMRVYVNALKNGRTDDVKPFLLIIEEINRANIAAVFGDIFQLLDRDENQVSEYPIQASEDMKKYLAKELGGEPDDYAKIKLPDNMFIWATMNSADQGVYPMDTAFKRRWDFEYIGINDGENKVGYYVIIPVKNNSIQKVKWNTLRKRINDNLLKEEVNEDKLLGPFFISKNVLENAEKDPEAFAKIFKSKVVMYLFEDAARQKKIRNSVFPASANNDSAVTLSGLFGKFDEIGVKLFGLDDKEFEEVQPSNDNSGNESKDGDPSDGSAIDNTQEKVQLEESVETTKSNSLSEDATGEGEN